MSALSRISLLAILALARSAADDDPAAQPQRGILQRHEQSGVPDKEIVLGTAPDGDGGVAVSTWIVDKGQPLATPVP
jgi:hypothetical protein